MSASEPLRHVFIAATLRARITDGTYPPGSRLPSESELREEFGTSRGPVRQAVDSLQREGLVAVSRGSAPRVLSQTPAQPFETMVSFTEWAESLGRRPGQQTIRVARAKCAVGDAERLGLSAEDAVVEVLRLRLLDEHPAMLERAVFPLEVGRLLFEPDFDPDRGSIYRHLAAHGVGLQRGSHLIDAVGADETDAEHLGVPVGSPLLRVRRVVSDLQGNPQEYGDDRYLPGTISISISNTAGQGGSLLSLNDHPSLQREH